MTTRKGFTIIELMIALMIIGIMAAALYPRYTAMKYRAAEAQVVSNMHVLQMVAEQYATKTNGIYPVDLTTEVRSIVNGPTPGISSDSTRIADTMPATGINVSTTIYALLPDSGRFVNPLLATGNCLDELAYAADPPIWPMFSIISPGASGQGTVYWAPCGLQTSHGGCTEYAIYGTGRSNIMIESSIYSGRGY